jgi:hypothetical protein
VNRRCLAACRTTGPTRYSHDPTKTCVNTCPSNYYGQVVSGVGICQTVCSGSFYGDNATNLCVNPCPSGTYGDPTTTKMCLKECRDGYFAQDTNPTRMCVTTCAATTFGNVLTKECETAATDCPTGTWAD